MPSNASSCTKMTDMLIKFWIYSSGSKCSVVRSAESIMFFLQLQIDLFFQTTMKDNLMRVSHVALLFNPKIETQKIFFRINEDHFKNRNIKTTTSHIATLA